MLIRTLYKGAWLAGGVVFFVLALIGLLLPIVPQLPFFLLSIFCFMRCSTRFNAWMLRQHWFERIKRHMPHRREK